MRTANKIWLASLILIAIGMALWVPEATESARQNAKPARHITKQMDSTASSGDHGLVTSNSPLLAGNAHQPISYPAIPSTESQKPIPTSRKLDLSVVGRTFPLPEAVEVACKAITKATCDDVHDKLGKMAQEPRDMLWAPAMEALIQSDVLSVEPGRFEVRDVECRKSLCAAEVESISNKDGKYGSYMGGMQVGHDALKAALQTNLNTWAYETDDSDVRVTVTVITFTRR